MFVSYKLDSMFPVFFSFHHDIHLILLIYHTVEHVSTVWAPLMHKHFHGVPIILVGTGDNDSFVERDRCNGSKSPSFVTFEEGFAQGREIGACQYLECNLTSFTAIEQVFLDAVRATRGVLLWVNENESSSKKADCLLQ